MKVAANIVVVVSAVVCLGALAISVYPGVLNRLFFFAILLSFLMIPVVGVAALVGIVLERRGKLRVVRIPWTQVAIIVAMLIGTFALLKLYVPRRIAFAAARDAFEQLVPQATASKYGGTSLKRRLGVYQVDEFAADPRGGVYFRVYRGMAGLSPDQMSYGFVYKPNRQGTPFGAAQYGLYRLGDDWYWFRVSDDWY